MTKQKTQRDIIESILMKNKETRGNDLLLIAKYCEKTNRPCDINYLARTEQHNLFESVRRCRQKIQEEIPALRPNKVVQNARNELKEVVKNSVKSF